MESTFKNIRPVSWSQQDTSPCLICDFMQHFIYCLLHFLLLFIYVFSLFLLSFIIIIKMVSTHPSEKILKSVKIMQNIFLSEKETEFLFDEIWSILVLQKSIWFKKILHVNGFHGFCTNYRKIFFELYIMNIVKLQL